MGDTNKVHLTLQQFEEILLAIKAYVDDNHTGSVEIVDNLLSDDTNKALSAKQGFVLNEKIESLYDNDPIFITSRKEVLYNDNEVFNIIK